MLISCSSCNSKYLLNSADLKPNGRTVQCAKCGHQWFQVANIKQEEVLHTSTSSSEKEIENGSSQNNIISNLPSTYVKEQKPKIINTILLIFFVALMASSFWLLKKNGMNLVVLVRYYVQEFYFSLNLIINDLAKIIHQILN